MFEWIGDWWWLLLAVVVAVSMGLKSGKTAPPEPPPRPLTDIEKARVLELLDGEGKIAAIKLFREFTACGLKQAKEGVEALDRAR